MTTPLWLLIIFSGIGILDTLYLVFMSMTGREVHCLFFPKEWCHTVQHSPQSRTLGVPNSLAGLVMYGLLLTLTLLFVNGAVPFWPIQAVVAFGFFFSMYFLYVQAFVLRAFCTWCVVSAINFTVMAIAAFLL